MVLYILPIRLGAIARLPDLHSQGNHLTVVGEGGGSLDPRMRLICQYHELDPRTHLAVSTALEPPVLKPARPTGLTAARRVTRVGGGDEWAYEVGSRSECRE